MDYAMKKGVSLSTLRRYIKADKLKHRSENGRYLIWDDEVAAARVSMTTDSSSLERQLKKAHEEIAELKMLVAIYEEQLAAKSAPEPLFSLADREV